MLLAIHLVMIMVFVILGVIFLNGKGAFLIAGYNTTSKAEKQKTDEKKLCSFMGKMMFILAPSPPFQPAPAVWKPYGKPMFLRKKQNYPNR